VDEKEEAVPEEEPEVNVIQVDRQPEECAKLTSRRGRLMDRGWSS
jgi:hypothetical protein